MNKYELLSGVTYIFTSEDKSHHARLRYSQRTKFFIIELDMKMVYMNMIFVPVNNKMITLCAKYDLKLVETTDPIDKTFEEGKKKNVNDIVN